MKKQILSFGLYVFVVGSIVSCKGKEADDVPIPSSTTTEVVSSPTSTTILASERIDLENKGVGPVTEIILTDFNQKLADEGQVIFTNKCTACHKPEKKFIGPAPKGILERRSPEWVMNMILNPENMIANDPLAKDLIAEFNGAPMANQNLTEQEARAVLEYFRSL